MKNYFDKFLRNNKNLFKFHKNENYFLIVDRGRYLPAVKASIFGGFINKKYKFNPILLSDLKQHHSISKIYNSFGIKKKNYLF